MVWTFPNILSLDRILVIPVLVYLLTFSDPRSSLLTAALFILASITDYFDGYLARRNKSISDIGKILDPLADKLMVGSVLIMLAAMDRPNEPSVPAWLIVVILARESAVTVIRGIALSEGMVMQVYSSGVRHRWFAHSLSLLGLRFLRPGNVLPRRFGSCRSLVRRQLPPAIFSFEILAFGSR